MRAIPRQLAPAPEGTDPPPQEGAAGRDGGTRGRTGRDACIPWTIGLGGAAAGVIWAADCLAWAHLGGLDPHMRVAPTDRDHLAWHVGSAIAVNVLFALALPAADRLAPGASRHRRWTAAGAAVGLATALLTISSGVAQFGAPWASAPWQVGAIALYAVIVGAGRGLAYAVYAAHSRELAVRFAGAQATWWGLELATAWAVAQVTMWAIGHPAILLPSGPLLLARHGTSLLVSALCGACLGISATGPRAKRTTALAEGRGDGCGR
jgi:hypothetical protein